MASFDVAVKVVLANEGVFSDDANDRGGRTKHGISTTTFAAYQRRFNALPGRDVASLTKAEAIEIYRAMFWKYDALSSQMIATKLFDIGVNRGVGAAVMIVQSALNIHPSRETWSLPKVDVDGLWGPATIAAISASCASYRDRLLLFKAMVLFQAKGYVDIVMRDPTQLDFIDGWISRAAQRPKD